MREHTPSALREAKRLRSAMSLPEVLLWRILRKQPQGVKFRRQHPLGPFVVDFYCAAVNVVVEIDGIAHQMGGGPERDARRDAWLHSHGKEVIRIAAGEVLADPDAVAEALVIRCRVVPPPSALRAATSPDGGGSL